MRELALLAVLEILRAALLAVLRRFPSERGAVEAHGIFRVGDSELRHLGGVVLPAAQPHVGSLEDGVIHQVTDELMHLCAHLPREKRLRHRQRRAVLLQQMFCTNTHHSLLLRALLITSSPALFQRTSSRSS